MSSAKRTKTHKKPYKQRVIKQKNKKKSRSSWGYYDEVSEPFLNNLNEVLRKNKAQRAEGKGSWKVMPKDSCEVYKARRNRKRKSEDNDESTFCTCSDMDPDGKEKKRPRKKPQRKRVTVKRCHERCRHHKERHQECSQSSFTCTRCSTSSYSTISEMDYE